jgi:hypothetical protein
VKKSRFKYAVLTAIPLLISPVLLFMLAESWLDFGGGEKDIVLIFPYFIWALIFFLSAIVLIIRYWPLRQWLIRSAAISTVIIVILAVSAYWMSWLGVS